MYTIKSIYVKDHDSGYGGYKIKYIATIEVPAVEFKKLKGDLGSLVLNVNNDLYKNFGVPAHYPSIDPKGHKRAVKGVKTMVFEYFSNDVALAQSLGLECQTLGGELCPKLWTSAVLSPRKAA